MECVLASYGSKYAVTASDDRTIIIWDMESGAIVHEWLVHGGHAVRALAVSPNSLRLVSASGGGGERLVVWDFGPDGVHKAIVLGGHTEIVTTCAWSPNGKLIASASGDGTVRLWDTSTFEQRRLLKDLQAVSEPRSLKFSLDAHYLAWISKSPMDDYTCVLWCPFGGKQPKRLPSHPTRPDVPINALAFNPESTRIATAHGGKGSRKPEECVVRIWDIATGAALAVLSGHSRQIQDVTFSPGTGATMLSASSDGFARLWDATSGTQTAALDMHPGTEALKASFSPDGEYVATVSNNLKRGPVLFWRTRDGSCVGVLPGHRIGAHHIVFSPDGKFLAVGDLEGMVHIHRISNLIQG